MERGGCAGGMCKPGHLSADSVSVVVTDLSLVIGLSVAITVFLCVTSIAVRIIRSKRTSHSVYNMADICKTLLFHSDFTSLDLLTTKTQQKLSPQKIKFVGKP